MGVRGRFLLLLGLRWLATGLLMPVALLLPLERGLTIAEIGIAMAAQGIVVIVMEVPSGALADSWGRRPVFIASGVAAIAAYALTLAAQSVLAFALAWGVSGLFRALDSGALESWFVDAENARGAADEVPSALATAGGVISAAIAIGSLLSAGLLYVSPWSAGDSLAVPYVLAIGIVVVQVVAARLLMEPVARTEPTTAAAWRHTLATGVRVAFGRRLRLLTAAMLLCGVAVAGLEMLMPVRLAEFSTDTSAAGSVLGVVSSIAWGLAALGATVASRVLREVGPGVVAPILAVAEGLGLAVMAIAGGPVALVAGFWLCYLVHTSFGAAYNALVHDRVTEAHRATALSVTSMAFLGSASAGGVALGIAAEELSAAWALAASAAVMLLAAVLVAGAARQRGVAVQR
ncbi:MULTISPECIES: MFS transporter [Aeromicrobium]|uniref:MFS transporter n=1 Tax=Aeromicrobium TaxID=2040 RepID=UPI00257D6229|nr:MULTISPECIES: MFS transporter [Aeromicrobium]